MLAAVESINLVLPVNPDCRAVAQGDFVRHLRPILSDFEGPLAASELHRHASSPLAALLAGAHHRHENADQASAARKGFRIALIVSQAYDAVAKYCGGARGTHHAR